MATPRLDSEEKRKRAILNRMARQGRLGDYLVSCLNSQERAEADALLEKMGREYDERLARRLVKEIYQ